MQIYLAEEDYADYNIEWTGQDWMDNEFHSSGMWAGQLTNVFLEGAPQIVNNSMPYTTRDPNAPARFIAK